MSVFASLACLLWMVAPTSPQTANVPATYILGPEDVISVDVLRHPEYSSEYVIPPDGSIELMIGVSVKAAGLTVTDLERKIRELMKSRLLKPEVSVSIKGLRLQRFYVLGDVRLSGVYDLKPGWSIAQALSVAGGLVGSSEISNPTIVITSHDFTLTLEHAATGQKIRMRLSEALDKSDDPSLQLAAGDVVRIELIQMFPVFVEGKVRSPGIFRIRSDSAGILTAIAEAGGPSDEGSIKNVKIIHTNGESETADLAPALVSGDVSQKLPTLSPGDTIIIPELLAKYSILGYISRPGFYPIPDGHTYQLSDVVTLAGGPAARGRLARIGLVRTVNGVQEKHIYDLGKYLHTGDMSQNPVVMAGDNIYVPETNKIDVGSIFAGIAAAALVYYYTKP